MNSLGLNKTPTETRVCVAMSGGVDSTAAVILLKNQGYDVFGLTLDLLSPPYAPAAASIQDAATVAEKLGIEHHFLDMKQDFRKKVVDYFVDSYLQGMTPTPCIMCNKEIKLGLLVDEAVKRGADIVVTGHYADIRVTSNGAELHRAVDLQRDQSYFLFSVDKEKLQFLRCPLALFSKDETREIVQKAGLEIYKKADSQDICFVQNGKYAELINSLRPQHECPAGNIVNSKGDILGQHRGIIHYTIGQRRGLGIGGGDILYVLRIDALKNEVVVGGHDELMQRKVLIDNVNWLGENRPDEAEFDVKLRSRQNLTAAKVRFLPENLAEVTLLHDFYGAAPGQGCCFYDGTRVMGGGIIKKVL